MPASFDGVAKAGSLLGSAAIIVMDDTTCMVWAAENLMHFYRHESCGKCTPCREGADWMLKILQQIERGEGEMRDLDLLESVANNINGKTLCPFGDAEVAPVLSTLQRFRHEFEAHIREGRCPLPADWRARGVTDDDSHSSSPSSACILLVFGCCCSSAAVMVYAERKFAALHAAALRPLPGRAAGAAAAHRRRDQAVLQGGAAAEGADSVLFFLAPSSRRRPPFPPSRSCRSAPRPRCSACSRSPSRLQVADVNVAVLVVFAIASMSVYGIVLAGWSSNSKYSLLGALRSASQMISYELSYGMSLAAVLVIAGSLSLREIVERPGRAVVRVYPAAGSSSCSRSASSST